MRLQHAYLVCVLIAFAIPALANIPTEYDEKHLYGNIHKNVHQELAEAKRQAMEHARLQAQNSHQPPVEKPAHDEKPRTAEEEMMYWFALNDLNKDGKLDGNELRVAFTKQMPAEADIALHDIEKMIEYILNNDDHNNDGEISWPEYMSSAQATGK
ncbi:hypothetical protein HK096_002763 [Nowakowskiella sp. JEL0078]|nr:hypothetical protein HK096_002763 [Nowakowskiella sp. JEL0078]